MKQRMGIFLSVFIVMVTVLLPGNVFANQPESSYWYPETLLEWSPETDPHAKYNRSTVPLAEREVLFPVNETQQTDAKLVALSALNSSTSGVPSQGGTEFFANTFSYWQYVDLMVYWAGSAGEGIITPPSADVIDASHRNGVPILGNVFFPPKVYGGQEEWVDQMLAQREDGSFPAADKLLEVAEYYGFDGWFINQETEGGTPETAVKMQEFLIYLQDNKPEEMHIMWYDSMISSGAIRWQNYLNDNNKMFLQDEDTRVADSMFLNFWWWNNSQKSSHEKALELGRSPYDLYSGIDVEANGTNTYVNWSNLFPDGEAPHTSLGIYRPDWAFKVTDNMQDFYAKEQEFWVGQSGDPTKTGNNPDNWKGMAHYFTEATVINELPFVTHFNTGSGQFFSIDGEVKSDQSWNNRSLQDVLPTWRWIRESDGEALAVDFDWEEAYFGGSSLKVYGELSPENATNVKLYKTNLEVDRDTEIFVTYKSSSKKPNMKVGVSFDGDKDEFEFFQLRKQSHDGWVTERIKLKKFAGERITTLSLFFESDEVIHDYQLNVGELKVTSKNQDKVVPEVPENLDLSKTFDEGLYADISLSWEGKGEVRHYEIYRNLENGEKEFVGATPNNVFFVPELRRDGKESTTTIEVVAVSNDFIRSAGTTRTFEWPPYPTPKADFTVSQTFAAPGSEIQFFNRSSEATEEVEWIFEGATPSTSTELNPTVVYEEEGTYSVRLIARNSEGEDIVFRENIITILEDASDIRNLALNQLATASGQCAPNEGPSYAVDGKVTNNSKWCAIGLNHWLKVDLGDVYQLSQFVIKHAEAGGEPAAFNTRSFTIETSVDGVAWENAVFVTNNSLAISEHSIPLTEARYVRLTVHQPTQGGDQAARIYELEAYGF
ncbi:endo-beta-N-acetylglucosaminidase D/PKD repeat protein [Evansella vedderi]|uniref:Endo-beta-N-acetylglucosaminidase D/PKD repeat protein n=1 Tax=Evansella vedderi TaxID=38282 RepID=A0ABT9ZXA7_9BACI|nr:discoidin domain-containing protein [Evansella vedderi]MDQ0255859.1 endo-beta-N-acetylglucosaminidase D/PKD repeat protein [Evansella vedderi]